MLGHFHGRTVDGSDLSASIDVMRKLPFIELMELLEFSVLRLDSPQACRPEPARAGLIGTLDWWFWTSPGECASARADASDVAVYICSSTAALKEAVLPDGDTLLDFGRLAGEARPVRAGGEARGLRLYASAFPGRRGRGRAGAADRATLRVDLKALLSRVVVPARVPQHLFELVASLVRSRVWVDVVRPQAVAPMR
ncbi:MAG: hypothetical protein ACN6PJ_12515 [Achromobacter sp.]|uniref:hypothetical protein n=1 Tax=Achromobacter sp. TaxID=134375 RepID=UPI003CFC3104